MEPTAEPSPPDPTPPAPSGSPVRGGAGPPAGPVGVPDRTQEPAPLESRASAAAAATVPSPEPSPPGPAPAPPDHDALLRARLQAGAARLLAEAKDLAVAGRVLKGLARVAEEPAKLAKALVKAEKALPPDRAETAGAGDLLAAAREHVRSAPERARRRLGLELKQACERNGLGFRVLSREDPVEVRIPPLLLRVDFAKGRADLLFAREVVLSARPDAEAIVRAHARTLRGLDAAFDPIRFLGECLAAYRAALAAVGRPFGERVELLDFLPYLALAKQSRQFRASPSKSSFRPYGKARFAYDVLRLRRAGALSRDGLRLNFGVATGSTATQKDRVVYLEDEQGDGEYKLTVFFTTAEG